jgi:hypothetical protein
VQSAGIGIGWLWILGLALLALLGLFLLWRGLRPRREGTTPYCRKCGYNLTGTDRNADDARCSECGSPVTADGAVVFGERVRRWRRVFVGLVIFLVGAAPLVPIGVGAARGVDWYRLRPTALVLRDLQSSNTTLAGRAANEMARRFNRDRLSDTRIRLLAETCLTEQSRPNVRGAVTSQLIDLLGALYERDRLTAGQVDRFFENLCLLELRVRPTVIRGREFPLQLVLQGRTPNSGVWARAERGEVRVDGQVMTRGSSTMTVRAPSAAAGSTTYLRATAAGRHQISVDIELQVYAGNGGSSEDARLLRTIPRTLTAWATVLEEEPPGYIVLRRSPDLDALIERSVRPRDVRISPSSKEGMPNVLECDIEVDALLPIGLAFDVRAEFGEHSLRMGLMDVSPGLNTQYARGVRADLPDQLPDTVNLILKASKEAAERSVDLFEIWDGELRFENVKVAPGDASQWPQTGGRYVPTIAPRTPAPSDREPRQP